MCTSACEVNAYGVLEINSEAEATFQQEAYANIEHSENAIKPNTLGRTDPLVARANTTVAIHGEQNVYINANQLSPKVEGAPAFKIGTTTTRVDPERHPVFCRLQHPVEADDDAQDTEQNMGAMGGADASTEAMDAEAPVALYTEVLLWLVAALDGLPDTPAAAEVPTKTPQFKPFIWLGVYPASNRAR